MYHASIMLEAWTAGNKGKEGWKVHWKCCEHSIGNSSLFSEGYHSAKKTKRGKKKKES